MRFKVLFVSFILAGGLFTSCEKEEVIGFSPNDSSDENLKSELEELFEETREEHNFSLKSSGQLNVPLSNKKNPFDIVGEKHNEALDLIRSQSSSDFDICQLTDLINREYNLNNAFNCSDINNSFDSGKDLFFNGNNYSSQLFDNLLSNNEISTNERNILNSTTIAVFGANNMNQKIALLKAAENYTRNYPHISEESRDRILTSFAIFRYSSFYWEIEEADDVELACSVCVAAADAYAYYWALNSPDVDDNVIQDNATAYSFSSLVSRVAEVIYTAP
ncbi:MAG: hypothetical protein COA32_05430 [Fluviicola sp.]|nr:MAG: hypothetical protein COA32_05430 [Fluviicola sp.]